MCFEEVVGSSGKEHVGGGVGWVQSIDKVKGEAR